ncbi:hypothetical protein BKA70DRAFT_1570170 [Coprinopsis sp. MPI-PUGE-AT-0042]|nr:hypothetical protein BKA70DRAFT_1570170 [Coprinopsis sp. MPI-PUGE-AT-0042]
MSASRLLALDLVLCQEQATIDYMNFHPSLGTYFANNVPLPDDLVPEWTRYFDDLSTSIDATEQEITELESCLAVAKQRQVDLGRKKDAAISCRSGSRCLPPEIIAHILFFSLELDVLPLDRPGRLRFAELRCVSSLWRTTAFTTPGLWRSLAVDVQEWDGDENGEESFTALLTSWFSRTGDQGGLHLAGLIHNLEQWEALAKPQSARHSTTDLTVYLPSPVDLNNWICDLRHLSKACPNLARLALSGTNTNISTFTHPSLTCLSISLPWLPHTSYLAGFPALEELVLLTNPQNDVVAIEQQPYVLKSLKRLTIKQSQSTFILHFMTCPSLNFLHFADIRRGKTPEHQFADTVKKFVQRSQADRVTFRLSKDPNAAILRSLILTKPHPMIHRLEIEDINQLLQTFKKDGHELPRTLEEVVIQRKPNSIVQGPDETEQMTVVCADIFSPRFGPDVPARDSPLRQAAAHFWKGRRQAAYYRHYVPIPHIVTVYIPDGRTDPELLEVQEEELYGTASLMLRFPDVSQGQVSQMFWETGGWIPYKDRVMYGT